MPFEHLVPVMKWRLRRARLKLHLRQEDVANSAGLSLRRYQTFEGESGRFNPTVETLLRICEAVKLPPHRLFAPAREEEALAAQRDPPGRISTKRG